MLENFKCFCRKVIKGEMKDVQPACVFIHYWRSVVSANTTLIKQINYNEIVVAIYEQMTLTET